MSVKIVRNQKNPLDWALGKLGMTRTDFQVDCGYSKPYLLRVSQGRQSQMSERVVSDLYSIASSKGVDLDSEIVGVYGPAISVPDAYDVWIHQHRKVQILPDPVKDPKLNPFMRLVVAVGSLSRMAALLAVHDHIVERYAKGITYEMPMTVMMALTDMQYPHIVALEQAMKKWGETHA